ncbi:3-oxoacyl-[acyl-carrier-protein] reductase FabG [Acaryochloris thomasi RCC1774]|uniref:3-oxoacyl-[acyl-carrier-protein] reductase FabG n=1 Tax=Acaryochloris thomasi RCC1774 TaxID=1764569 RepID=A0A2W1K689_9CYAN|nr:SDR family NAD(P)-dependent oxidoreductase [Acaryochloris thomasi]PZD75271.1 3-oxoacyl-[acyl-carrier-protein] reductase FabG [Acaryochloris thomasi RCC1774]
MAKRIVLTGVTKGLGQALTDGLIDAGHTLLGCGRSAEAIAHLSQQYPAPHQFTVVDVAQADQVVTWANELLGQSEAPDLLLNNAGLVNSPAPLWEISDSEFTQVTDVNLRGVANTIRSFVPAMIDRGQGVIVNFSSGWGRSTSPDVTPYCATKWAIEGLTQALAQELPKGLATVALNPGIINTEMLQTCFGNHAAAYPTTEQWGRAAVPFILRLSAQHNGQSLTVPS